jgi:fumarylacetoacetase
MIDPAEPKRGSKYGLTRSLHFKLEVAFVIERVSGGGGGGGTIGRPMTAEEARGRIFGYVLMNDWSARDVQRWG